MTDGDGAEIAAALELPAAWCEISMTNDDGHQIADAGVIRLVTIIMDDVASGKRNPLERVELRVMSGDTVHVRAGDIAGITPITPAYRRWSIARQLLNDREVRMFKHEHKADEWTDDE